MATVLVWASIAVVSLFVQGLVYWIAARIVRVESAALFGRAMLSSLATGIVSAALVSMVWIITGRDGMTGFTVWLTAVLVITFSVVILRSGLESGLGKAMAVWCTAVGITVAVAALSAPGLVYAARLLEDMGVTTVAMR